MQTSAHTARGQQEQLQQLLSHLGADVPVSAVPSFPAGSALHKWLLESLCKCSEKQQRHKKSGNRDDLHSMADQGVQPPAAPAWLVAPSPSHQQALQASRCMEPVHEGQLRELQHLDRALGKQLQELQQAQDRTSQLLHDRSRQLNAQQCSIKESNSQFNRQLQALQTAIEDAQQQITVHGSSWLLVVADMAQYIKANAAYSHCLEKLVVTMSGRSGSSLSGATSDSLTAQPAALPAPGGVLSGWEARPAPSGSMTSRRATAGWQLASDLSAEEHEALIQEMNRLRVAYSLGEVDDVMARVGLAGATAQVDKLRQMLQDESGASQGHGYTPWLHPAECERLAARIHGLQKEADSLKRELPALIERVGQLQDTYLLKGDYERLAARKQSSIQGKQAVVDALAGWGAQGLILDKLRTLDISKLGEVHKTIQDLSDALSLVVATSQQRCAAYGQVVGPAGSTSTPPPASPLVFRSPAASTPSMRQRQQIEDHSYLDTMHQVLHEQLPAGKAVLPPPATIKSVTQALQKLASSNASAEQTALEQSAQGLPRVVGEAVKGAQVAKDGLCDGKPGLEPVTRAVELVHKQAELENLNKELQERLNEVVRSNNTYNTYRTRDNEPENLDRTILTQFYNQPEWLTAQYEELLAQVAALAATAQPTGMD